jgi:predicted nucleic acid-binding protein
MLYLDNDVLAKYARPDPDPAVVQYLEGHSDEPWGISAIVAYEFASFYKQSVRRDKLRQLETKVVEEVTPVDGETSVEAADLRSTLESAGTSLGTGDLLVAATAR